MRKIPATMATQHPDNATAPYWDARERPFISAYQEIAEALTCFQDLGASEYMWDWEGKHADAAVIDRLFSEQLDYFSSQQLGRDKFLTFRIPNIWEEKGYNLLQAMTVILSSEDFARDLQLANRPLFEVILPMTERADQLLHMQELFQKLAHFKSEEFTTQHETNTDYLEIIPLLESVESQLGVKNVLQEYVQGHEQHFGRRPDYIRTFLAGSDSSLAAGFLAGIIGNKIALSRLHEFASESGIPIYPIFGYGSLLFRGGLAPTPASIDRFLVEFPGVRTVTTQSAFRYDYPLEEVKAAIKRLEEVLPQAKPHIISAERQQKLIAVAENSADIYKATVGRLATIMQAVFAAVPKRRDRRQHIGLLAYSRSMGEQTLPRAITYTAGFYSVGVPPEFIGLGRTLRQLSNEDLTLLREEYVHIAEDFASAGRYLNRDNLNRLAAKNDAWQEVADDVVAVESVLGITLGAQTAEEKRHQALSSELLDSQDVTEQSRLITEMAVLRRSLG